MIDETIKRVRNPERRTAIFSGVNVWTWSSKRLWNRIIQKRYSRNRGPAAVRKR
jgi:hypothetical protein